MKWRWILPLLALVFIAAAKRQPEVSVRFHTEANARDGESFSIPVQLQNPPRQSQIKRMPEINERDIVAVWPFQAPDGTMGCGFKLDANGKIRVNAASLEYRGTSMVAFVNGRQVIDMLIDQPVSGDWITIQRGLSVAEIELLTKRWPIEGQTKKKKK